MEKIMLNNEITKVNNECYSLFIKLKTCRIDQHSKIANKLIDKRIVLYHLLKENLRLKASA